jgi:hypothetical protein
MPAFFGYFTGRSTPRAHVWDPFVPIARSHFAVEAKYFCKVFIFFRLCDDARYKDHLFRLSRTSE